MPTDALQQPPEAEVAHYDRILVEVKPDGQLQVLGEQMEMDAFRTLLDDQLREHLPTVVTIVPDDDCLFRHVGPVITVCEQAGVPHSVALPPSDPA